MTLEEKETFHSAALSTSGKSLCPSFYRVFASLHLLQQALASPNTGAGIWQLLWLAIFTFLFCSCLLCFFFPLNYENMLFFTVMSQNLLKNSLFAPCSFSLPFFLENRSWQRGSKRALWWLLWAAGCKGALPFRGTALLQPLLIVM